MPFNLLDHRVYHSTPARAVVDAWNPHVPFGMLLVDLLRPALIVELGASLGASYGAFCQAVAELGLDTRCVAVGSWVDYSQAPADPRAQYDPLYASFSTRMRSRPEDAVDSFGEGSIDLLHLSDFQTDDAARGAFEAWLPRMSARGVVLLHNTAERGPDAGVARFWEDMKRAYPRHLDFEQGHGLGLVVVGERTPEGLQSVLDLPPEQWASLRDLLRDLGEAFDARVLSDARLKQAEARAERERSGAAQVSKELLEQQGLYAAQRRELAETQRRLDNALWQLEWLNRSRGVRMVKLARASRALLRQRGAGQLAKRVALWTVGKRGYHRLDSAAALPVPKQPRPAEREHKQVMYLSGCPGGAMRYRCDHQAEQLNLLGCSAESAPVSTVNLMELLDRFQCFVLHRVPLDTDVQAFITEARKRGKPLFFETDDLVFDPERASTVAVLDTLAPLDRKLYIDEIRRVGQTLRLCDAATVSTETLREWVEPICSRVAVTPNVMSQEMVTRSRMALAAHAASDPGAKGASAAGEVVIAYFSGSPSHDRDFREAQDALLWALETYPQARFLLVGPLTLSEQFDRFGARVRREKARPWQALPTLYADVDINLAPLERDNPFTDAKSSIKYMEAALLKVPTIASPRRDFTRVMRHGENGLLADSPDAWRAALGQLIESHEERRRLGERSHEEVMRLYTTVAQAPLVFDVMRSHYRAVNPSSGERSLRINWVIDTSEAGRPQAGTLRLASGLAKRGHVVRVVVEGSASAQAATWAAEVAPAQITIGYDAMPAADASVATSAATAPIVAESHESLFKFMLTDAASAGADDAVIATTPLQPICLAQATEAPAGETSDAEVDRIARLLTEHCW